MSLQLQGSYLCLISFNTPQRKQNLKSHHMTPLNIRILFIIRVEINQGIQLKGKTENKNINVKINNTNIKHSINYYKCIKQYYNLMKCTTKALAIKLFNIITIIININIISYYFN